MLFLCPTFWELRVHLQFLERGDVRIERTSGFQACEGCWQCECWVMENQTAGCGTELYSSCLFFILLENVKCACFPWLGWKVVDWFFSYLEVLYVCFFMGVGAGSILALRTVPPGEEAGCVSIKVTLKVIEYNLLWLWMKSSLHLLFQALLLKQDSAEYLPGKSELTLNRCYCTKKIK